MKLYTWLLFALLATALASSCKLLQRDTPQEKLTELITQYPELVQPETIRVQVPFAVPQVEFQTRMVPVRDTVWERQERHQLDSLLSNLQASLSEAEQAAAKAKLQQLLNSRPVLRDTLCFDTLGVKGRIWLQGRTYHLHITRAEIRDTVAGTVAAGKLNPCPPPLPVHYLWYDPNGWPWLVVFLLGVTLGVGLTRWLIGPGR